jgi:hypothetical protein
LNILIYKRTHIGDPDHRGLFGINDCMGRVRNLKVDAVIGVGGIGNEPKTHQIDKKVNWIGVSPKKQRAPLNYRGPLITFEKFLLLDDKGPLFENLAPQLANRVYKDKARYFISKCNENDNKEAKKVIDTLLEKHPQSKQFKRSYKIVRCIQRRQKYRPLQKCSFI